MLVSPDSAGYAFQSANIMTSQMEMPKSPGLHLPLMPIQSGAQDPIDDWTGITNSVLRRRIQNRLNQRAFRFRQQESSSVRPNSGCSSDHQRNHHDTPSSSTFDSKPNESVCKLSEVHDSACTYLPPDIHQLMNEYERNAVHKYLTGSPQLDHLNSLSRVNILRAAYQNVVVVGMAAEWLCADKAISVFSITNPSPPDSHIPACLRPTTLQHIVPHHPWVDIFPFPGMRDNLIRAGNHLDHEEFCHDITGFWDTRRDNATLLVWGAPWDPQNWEVTEEFARKWGLLLGNCPELLVSSNAWRRLRGEKPLYWRRILKV